MQYFGKNVNWNIRRDVEGYFKNLVFICVTLIKFFLNFKLSHLCFGGIISSIVGRYVVG